VIRYNTYQSFFNISLVSPSSILVFITYTLLLSSHCLAIELLKANPDKIDWDMLSINKNTIELLKDNKDKINWINLSRNENAIELLKANPDKINWKYLSRNLSPDAIELFRKNQDKINWNCLSFNPLIFTYDYEKIKKNFEELGEEIIAKALHPKRIFRLIEEYGEDEIYNI
jgi:hypothetical protein